ncbi:MAG: LysR family transcriptional regulator [Tepidisphaeraceae bacterium]
MELRQLGYFLTIAEEMNFGRAAERLEVAQPALSRQIQGLERELGVALFDRTRRQIRLTPAGEAFRGEAQRLMSQADHARTVAQRAARGETGRVSVAFVGSVMYGPMPAAMRVFRQRFPSVQVALHEMETGLQGEALRAGQIDVGLLRAPLGEPLLAAEVLLREPMIVALPTSHPLSRRDVVPLKALKDEPFVLFPRGRVPSFADQVVAACGAAGFQPSVSQEVTELQTGISLVAAGFGVCIVPKAVEKLRRPGLVFRALADPQPQTSLVATYRADNDSPALREFLRALRDHAADPGAR